MDVKPSKSWPRRTPKSGAETITYGGPILSEQKLKDMLEASRKQRKDTVNHPDHYQGNGIECIDAMKACVLRDEFLAHLKLTAIKYLWRYERKANPLEDIRKAQWYLNRLEQELSNAIK